MRQIKDRISKRKEFETVKSNESNRNQGSVLHNKPLNDSDLERNEINKSILNSSNGFGEDVSVLHNQPLNGCDDQRNMINQCIDNSSLVCLEKEVSVLQNKTPYSSEVQQNSNQESIDFSSNVETVLQNEVHNQPSLRCSDLNVENKMCNN